MKENGFITRVALYTKKHGILATIIASIKELYIKTTHIRFIYYKFLEYLQMFSVDYLVHRKRMKLTYALTQQMNNVVRYGLFKGFKFKHHRDWNGNMYLGLYEKEVLDYLHTIPRRYRTLINLGASDGYYAAGSVIAGIFNQSYCFELSKEGRENIKNNARLNSIKHKVKIYGLADNNFVELLLQDGAKLSQSVMICDIEGNEFELLNSKVLSLLKRTIIIVEIHDWHKNGAQRYNALKKNANQYFNLKEVKTGSRDLSIFPEIKDLKDNDRWLLCSEGRHYLQTWLILEPK